MNGLPGVFRIGAGGAVKTVADKTDGFGGFGGLEIDDSGAVAFIADRDAGGRGLSSELNGVLTEVANNDGPISDFGVPTITDGGAVLANTQLDAGGRQVIRIQDGLLTELANTDGAFAAFGTPQENAAGDVAFSAILDRVPGNRVNPQGIFVGGDPVADRVIGTGDLLFGSALRNFGFGGINDAGELAFRYTLADGTSGVALAVAADVIPEPASLAPLGLGGVVLLRRRA